MSVATQMRIPEAQRVIIDRAASATGKSRTEFMVSASLREAEEVLRDQRIFVLDSDAFDRFIDYLEAPARPNDKLRNFLSEKSPWD